MFAHNVGPSRMALLDEKKFPTSWFCSEANEGKPREGFYGYNATTLNRRLWQSSTVGEFHQRNGRVRQRAADFG